eukprot:6822387-Pyramimonas_sp.AAC.1
MVRPVGLCPLPSSDWPTLAPAGPPAADVPPGAGEHVPVEGGGGDAVHRRHVRGQAGGGPGGRGRGQAPRPPARVRVPGGARARGHPHQGASVVVARVVSSDSLAVLLRARSRGVPRIIRGTRTSRITGMNG